MVKRIQLLLFSMLIVAQLVQAAPKTDDPVVQALKAKRPVVVLFTKRSCPFCVWLKPLFNQLQTKSSNITSFLVVDVSVRAAYYKSKYRINTVPTVIYFNKKGQEIVRHGSNNKKIKLSQMQQYLKRAVS